MLRHLKLGLCAGAVMAASPPAGALIDDEARQAKIQATISDAWDDATATWQGLLGERAYRSVAPTINFVSAVRASHCYGLYIGAGPVYCSGNTTVFVSVASMQDLDKRVPGVGDAGLAFLVAHELGHHVQNISGRFRVLNQLVRNEPARQREYALRFELEADCLAGVWASKSPKFAATEGARSEIVSSLDAIGDDKILAAAGREVDPSRFTHGSSEQRVRWFRTGLDGGSVEACNVLQSETF
jgi:uncharacterized protein